MPRVVSELIKPIRSSGGDRQCECLQLCVRERDESGGGGDTFFFYRREQKDAAAKADKMSIVRSGMQPHLYAHLAGHYNESIVPVNYSHIVVTLPSRALPRWSSSPDRFNAVFSSILFAL